MATHFVHTNLIARDWQALSRFYCQVFECKEVGPRRAQSGAWLEEGTGVHGASLEGVHLQLPGFDADGPTLEIHQYQQTLGGPPHRPNRAGLRHLAFAVDDVSATLARLVDAGGEALGQPTRTRVDGVGDLEFVYATDPEGNVVEIQRWTASSDAT